MAVTGTLRLQGRLLGGASGPRDVDVTWPVTDGRLTHEKVNLTTAALTVTLPAGTTVVVLVPPAGNATSWGVSTDGAVTAFVCHPTKPLVLSVDTSLQAAIYLRTISGTITGLEVWAA